ncbi:hypothetical protein M2390_002640 [Mycetocola sp. BIGb0189]|uniref:hypothetical protein n=1 Tax=Mycetocola sp. BIGb0189 TaxID=2940604 RepID=UPI00216A1042|nr:hypothetical protein [Mycetocola sp. BIGb0189]MCS4277434.1 hypothetical protein [Mycetocola sp. BIGb0189]
MSNRNTLIIDGDLLRVRPRGLDRFWCFRRELAVPLAAIREVRVVPKKGVARGLRTLGADLGFKISGTYYAEGAVNFWNYRAGGPLLAITLAPAQEGSTHLFLSVGDPEVLRERIEKARAAHPSAADN